MATVTDWLDVLRKVSLDEPEVAELGAQDTGAATEEELVGRLAECAAFSTEASGMG
jgi:hypothetical protein